MTTGSAEPTGSKSSVPVPESSEHATTHANPKQTTHQKKDFLICIPKLYPQKRLFSRKNAIYTSFAHCKNGTFRPFYLNTGLFTPKKDILGT
jgi:hypothetical protein